MCDVIPSISSSISDHLRCRQLLLGRIVIVCVAVLGILPLLANPTALDATTISGTIIMGLGPPVYALIWIEGYRPLTFHVPFWW
jgi:SSS family solute:Na+ symporter